MGALLITKLYVAALSRVDTPEPLRRDYHLFIDEFPTLSTQAFANILSEIDLEAIVPPDLRFAYHVCCIAHGRELCRPKKPKCRECPLRGS